jgi:hypothetical protein
MAADAKSRRAIDREMAKTMVVTYLPWSAAGM